MIELILTEACIKNPARGQKVETNKRKTALLVAPTSIELILTEAYIKNPARGHKVETHLETREKYQ